MQFLKKYKEKYGRHFWLAVMFVTLEALCDLSQPTIMSHVIDVGIAGRQVEYIVHMGALMLFITAVGAIAASYRNVLSSRVSQNVGAEIRAELFEKIQYLSFTSIDRLDRASLVTRITNDVTQVQLLVNGMMRIALKAPLLGLGGLIMAASLNPQLAVILLAVVPVVALLIIMNMKIGFPLFINVQNTLDQVNRIMREYLAGVRVVKAFNRFGYEKHKFFSANKELQCSSIKAMRMMAAFSPGITLTMNIGIVLVLWFGGLRVSSGQMQIGHVIAFINYMTQILFSLMIMSMVFNVFVRAQASAGRIAEVLSLEETIDGNSNPDKVANGIDVKGRVDFEHVFFSYEGNQGEPTLKDINFTCSSGEFVGVIGSTGAGKSSMVSLIPRFYDSASGLVKVNGKDVREINLQDLREKIAIVPQKSTLFSGTIEDNIRWGNEHAAMQDIEKAAQMAEAHEFISSFPEGYQTRLGQGGVNLSGGQKQRIAIARALVRNPEILILDDSTSAVDVATEVKIKEAIRQYARQITCFIIAQRISSVLDADKIIVLDNGRIVGIGVHEELIKNCHVYQEIFQSQMGKELKPHVS